MTPKRDESRDLSPAGAFDKLLIVVAIMGAAVAILAAIVAFRGESAAAAEGGDAGTPETQVVSYALTEFAIDGSLEIGSGATQFEVTNDGSVAHNLSLEGGPSTPDLNAGDSAGLEVGDLTPGSYVIFCTIAGHREAGMEATVTVVEGEAPSDDASHENHEGDDVDWARLDQLMVDSMLAFPAETEGRGNQILEPTILADGTKEFHLTAAITPWEVEPGKIVDAWTYNGMVPAPAIQVEVGDKVRVVLDNQLPMGTDIHWHGVKVPNNMDGVAPLTQPLIKPGESFVYEFTTREPMVAMYHAHAHGHMTIPNGLFGTFVIGEVPLPLGQSISGIEIPDDLEVSQEIPMVLNDAGVIGLSLNGKSFPATEPYTGKVGDWVVVHYYNEGLQIHPMHQHQFPALVYAKDGIPLDSPYWVDTLNVAPGERYSVLFHLEDPGVWVWHCHILTHVERDEGMFGMVTAWIVEEWQGASLPGMLRKPEPSSQPVDDLLDLFMGDERKVEGRPWLLVNFISSADGGTAIQGKSSSLGDEDDKAVFQALRAVPDIVLVGSATVEAENYHPVRLDEARRERRLASGLTEVPLLAIVSGRLSFDPEARVFSDPDYRPMVITGPEADPAKLALLGDAAEVIILDDVTPENILARLGAASVILCEGGPTLVGQFVAARLVDELNLTVAPTMIGGESARIAHGDPADPPLDMRLDRYLIGDRSLFLRYLRA